MRPVTIREIKLWAARSKRDRRLNCASCLCRPMHGRSRCFARPAVFQHALHEAVVRPTVRWLAGDGGQKPLSRARSYCAAVRAWRTAWANYSSEGRRSSSSSSWTPTRCGSPPPSRLQRAPCGRQGRRISSNKFGHAPGPATQPPSLAARRHPSAVRAHLPRSLPQDGELTAAETAHYVGQDASFEWLEQEGWSVAAAAQHSQQALDGADAGGTVSQAELAAHLRALLQASVAVLTSRMPTGAGLWGGAYGHTDTGQRSPRPASRARGTAPAANHC